MFQPNKKRRWLPAIKEELKETIADTTEASKILNWAPKIKLENYIKEFLKKSE